MEANLPIPSVVPADNDTRVSLASRELHVRVSLEVVLRDGVANGVGCHHVLVVIGMLLEVFLQHEAEDG